MTGSALAAFGQKQTFVVAGLLIRGLMGDLLADSRCMAATWSSKVQVKVPRSLFGYRCRSGLDMSSGSHS